MIIGSDVDNDFMIYLNSLVIVYNKLTNREIVPYQKKDVLIMGIHATEHLSYYYEREILDCLNKKYFD